MSGSDFDLRKDGVEFRALEEATVREDCIDFSCVPDVFERAGIEEHEIGDFTGRDRTETIFRAEKCRGVAAHGLKSFHRRKAGLDKIGKFVVQAETGKDVHAGRCVGACEKLDAGGVHALYDLQVAPEVLRRNGRGSRARSGRISVSAK